MPLTFLRTVFLCAIWALLTLAVLIPGRPALALDEVQRFVLSDINRHFNETRHMKGAFVQIGPNGERSEGQFYMSKPGKIRFEYDAPSPLLIVANGRWVGISDMRERTTERYPLASTPLKLLLKRDLSLMDETEVLDVILTPELITVIVEESAGESVGRLALMFDGATYDLRQWVVTDAQGLDTSVALYNVLKEESDKRRLFVIPDYDRIQEPERRG
ncbi:MAG: outer-membrane lipoprotein carrier protein LolA [Pseudomonadota bacterium]